MKHLSYSILAAVFVAIFAVGANGQSYKIKQKISMAGQTFESTTYVKGQRKRSERSGIMGIGGDVADIEQCDLKQYVKVNDKKKLYFIEPFDNSIPVAPTPRQTPAKTANNVIKGGTVTMTTTAVDTGERKQVNGFTARRVKTSISSEASPDACTKQTMKIETDGWYIDLPEFVCPVNIGRELPEYERPTGCRDKFIVKSNGNARKGFALSETMTFTQGGQSFTQTTETVEVSKAALDQALFEVPASYKSVNDSNDLYGRPDFAEMMKAAEESEKTGRSASTSVSPMAQSPVPTGVKKPGMIRIGVIQPSNRSGESVSTEGLQSFLIRQLTAGNVEAVPLSSVSDASSLACDYIVTTEISKLKQSTAGKIGGFLGKATGTSIGGSSPFDAQVDYVMTRSSDSKVVIKNKAAKKADGPVDKAAEAVFEMAASALISLAK